MKRSEILEDLNEIFKETLDNKDIVLGEDTKADDVDEWDSLTHVLLVVSTEKHFQVSFKSDEIQKWENVGEIIDAIQKLSA